MTEYGRIHTDDSRSGGQPVVATEKAHAMVREVLAEWGIEPRSTTPVQLTIATTEALCRAIEQQEDLRQPTQADITQADITQADMDAAESILWVDTIIDDREAIAKAFARHRLAERAAIVAWLRRYPKSVTSAYDWKLSNRIEAGEHLK